MADNPLRLLADHPALSGGRLLPGLGFAELHPESLRLQPGHGLVYRPAKHVRQTDMISFSLAWAMVSISFTFSSVSFCTFSSSFF